MKSCLLVLIGAVAVSNAQSAIPKWIQPTKSSFVELTAYNLAGYTPQQLWGWRNVERIVKFDTTMNCVYEGFKSNGAEQRYDAYCWSKDVHWNVNSYPQCSSGQVSSVSVANQVKQIWSYYDAFTVYQGQVDDPYYNTGVKFHRAKHATQNRWIWFRTSDKAIVYEQYYDGTANSWVKYFEGGIVENRFLFTSDFRIPKCSNPYIAMPSVAEYEPTISFFQAPKALSLSENITTPAAGEPVPMPPVHVEDVPAEEVAPVEETEISDVERWIFETYDTNQNGKLSVKECKELVKDLDSWYIGKDPVESEDFEKWFIEYDADKDGQLSIDEIFKALQ